MSDELSSLCDEYLDGLQIYLRQGGEESLSQAYELGRRAMVAGLGVLEVAALHQAAIDGLVLTASKAERVRAVQSAAAYFSELLSPFEMSLRGYRVANDQLQQLNESLRRQMAETESINRELESFSYSVSHDLRAPLRGINGYSQLLLEHGAKQLDATGRRYLRNISDATARMGQLIDDLLSLARVTRSEMQRGNVDLTALARSICDRLHTDQPERDVEFTIEAGLHVQGDRRLLAVLLENLLGNAWKFTSKRAGARIEFGCVRGSGPTVYHVRDNGAGFDMAHASKLFITFSRLHAAEEFEGSGIGLATVQRVVHRHEGEIWALGEVDGGATFFFTLEGGRKEMRVEAIRHESDLVMARQQVRALAWPQCLSPTRTEALATAVTEIARNILAHAGQGEMQIGPIAEGMRHGVAVVLRDSGPGIADIERAMQDGFSTSGSLGLGLAGAKRLVDEFEITSGPHGTMVTLRQWAK